jgi:hypothetical protein
MSNRPQQSDPIRTMFGPVTVTARPVRKGHQLAPEIVVTDSGRAQIMHLSPAQARALADALRDAADRAEQ